MVYTLQCDSPVGMLTLAERNGALAGLWIEGQKYFFSSLREECQNRPDSPLLLQARRWLDRYFAGERPAAGELPLAPAGSEFRREVFKILCEIPYGQTTTYQEIAQKIAARRGLAHMSAQAVGGAVGHNPISIIIPCHRVVGSRGSLTGYAGGLQKKVCLLTHEGVDMRPFFLPKKGTAL
ncbi:MAG: methylated-DNA--[protein]-cysteine S-methyltransferase [Provencibacterium sp.]|jgi:methylated-DNA-[protein]-cysteine S-methyltransferase|nr:methylated-DNA--[protein]-cysteine S-methyltransferase [Provencibacterium sp.]